MAKTVLVTGSSSGIGRATAIYFQKQGWNVVATMRSPEKEKELNQLPNVLCAVLDVTKIETLKPVLAEAISKFGKVDVLVNNAGYSLSGPFESTTSEQVRKQFATNVFGLMDVSREILAHFRKNKAGVLINVASAGGRLTVPLYSPYHATKWAVEGFSEGLQYELKSLNIRVKIIEPGAIKTDFYSRSADTGSSPAIADYSEYLERARPSLQSAGENGISPEKVASVIFKAATDGSSKLRYPVGMDAKPMLLLRRFVPDRVFMNLVERVLIKGPGPARAN